MQVRLLAKNRLSCLYIMLLAASTHSIEAAFNTVHPKNLLHAEYTVAANQLKIRSKINSIPRHYWSSGFLRKDTNRYRFRRLQLSTDGAIISAIQSNGHSILPPTYMILLAIQFAIQPLLTKSFAPKGIIRSTYVFAQDVIRLLISVFLLTITKSWHTACCSWNICGSLQTAGVSSVLYLIQSYCSLIAYQSLTPITYNVLNQTKTISAAVFCYLLLGERQSTYQMLSLALLLLSSLIMENIVPMKIPQQPKIMLESTGNDERKDKNDCNDEDIQSSSIGTSSRSIKAGILPILIASLISGLAGAWTQRSLRDSLTGSNSLFFSLQLSMYSIVSMITALLIPGLSADRELLSSSSYKMWFRGWTPKTWIPIVVNAIGGILVGLVTKTSGVVAKGFALILGMFLSGLLQNKFSGESVSKEQWIGGLLAAVSVWMHTSYPYNNP